MAHPICLPLRVTSLMQQIVLIFGNFWHTHFLPLLPTSVMQQIVTILGKNVQSFITTTERCQPITGKQITMYIHVSLSITYVQGRQSRGGRGGNRPPKVQIGGALPPQSENGYCYLMCNNIQQFNTTLSKCQCQRCVVYLPYGF